MISSRMCAKRRRGSTGSFHAEIIQGRSAMPFLPNDSYSFLSEEQNQFLQEQEQHDQEDMDAERRHNSQPLIRDKSLANFLACDGSVTSVTSYTTSTCLDPPSIRADAIPRERRDRKWAPKAAPSHPLPAGVDVPSSIRIGSKPAPTATSKKPRPRIRESVDDISIGSRRSRHESDHSANKERRWDLSALSSSLDSMDYAHGLGDVIRSTPFMARRANRPLSDEPPNDPMDVAELEGFLRALLDQVEEECRGKLGITQDNAPTAQAATSPSLTTTSQPKTKKGLGIGRREKRTRRNNKHRSNDSASDALASESMISDLTSSLHTHSDGISTLGSLTLGLGEFEFVRQKDKPAFDPPDHIEVTKMASGNGNTSDTKKKPARKLFSISRSKERPTGGSAVASGSISDITFSAASKSTLRETSTPSLVPKDREGSTPSLIRKKQRDGSIPSLAESSNNERATDKDDGNAKTSSRSSQSFNSTSMRKEKRESFFARREREGSEPSLTKTSISSAASSKQDISSGSSPSMGRKERRNSASDILVRKAAQKERDNSIPSLVEKKSYDETTTTSIS